MNLIDREVGTLPMAYIATLAEQRRRVLNRVPGCALISVAPEASRALGRCCRDVVPWRLNREQIRAQGKLFRAADMTFLAVPSITGERDAIEVMDGPTIAIHGVIARQICSRVNLVGHSPEVDRLRGIVGRWPDGAIRGIWIVAKDAHLNLVAIPSVNRKAAVTTVAIIERYHRPARLDRAAVYREGDNFVGSPLVLFHLLVRAGIERVVLGSLDADCPGSGRSFRNLSLECVSVLSGS